MESTHVSKSSITNINPEKLKDKPKETKTKTVHLNKIKVGGDKKDQKEKTKKATTGEQNPKNQSPSSVQADPKKEDSKPMKEKSNSEIIAHITGEKKEKSLVKEDGKKGRPEK